jgi:hypothetical protein
METSTKRKPISPKRCNPSKSRVNLPIKVIRLDFQNPDLLFNEKVWEIAQAMLRGDTIPAIMVRFDGENYWLEDGFHRVAAAISLDREEIDAEVNPGTLADMEAEWAKTMREHRGKWRKDAGRSSPESHVVF